MRSGGDVPAGLGALQIDGGLVVAGAILTNPFLGFLGFNALGPVAGTAAAGWQSSMGVVSAGSLFDWCQSAAVGGAAATGVFGAGIAGGTLTAAATLTRSLRRDARDGETIVANDDDDEDESKVQNQDPESFDDTRCSGDTNILEVAKTHITPELETAEDQMDAHILSPQEVPEACGAVPQPERDQARFEGCYNDDEQGALIIYLGDEATREP